MTSSFPSPVHLPNRYNHHPRDNLPNQLPIPVREHPPLSHALPKNHRHPKPRGAVPFNRLQLAAALIEYNDDDDEFDSSEINWSIQQIPPQPRPPIKHAPHSAIFIPFRQSAPPKKLDFFADINLPSSPKTPAAKSASGFGLVNDPGPSRLPTLTDGQKHISSVGLLDSHPPPHVSPPDQIDVEEVLSEWGLDDLLPHPAPRPSSDSQGPPSSAPENVCSLQKKTGRVPDHLAERSQVKSDLFDFHFSELRLQNDEDRPGPTATTDFFAQPADQPVAPEPIDDEALLRQRAWCDPEGRQLLRPQSVMELVETQLLYQHPKKLGPANLKGKQAVSGRGALSGVPLQDASKARRRAALRTQSLSPARAIDATLHPPFPTTATSARMAHVRSASGTPAERLPRARRKSVLDEPSTRRLSVVNPLQGVLGKRHKRLKSLPTLSYTPDAGPTPIRTKKSSAITAASAHTHSSNPEPDQAEGGSEPKLKQRTSADIAERYQQSIALLDSRKSEDIAYDVPQPSGSSSAPEDAERSRDRSASRLSQMPTQLGSAPPSKPGSEFSLGVPKQFTSRFDPKVNSVLSLATPSGLSQAGRDEFEDEEQEDPEDRGSFGDELESGNDEPIYDEHGRIRFPTSLKPIVLIMPIPLTPAEPEPEAQPEEEAQPAGEATDDQAAVMRKVQEHRPAGKLYGRSLIDELNSRKGGHQSRQMTSPGDRRTRMFADNLAPEDASRPGSVYSAVDPHPGARLRLPNSPTSPTHLANQALSATQHKFNQALLDSSKARKSVFGLDTVMLAELEKLKKIKAAEDREIRETEAKAEAKEAKKQEKQARKRKGKKGNVGEEDRDQVAAPSSAPAVGLRASYVNDNWDAILERESRPVTIARAPPEAEQSSSSIKYSLPLPVILSPVRHGEETNQVSNINDWFSDRPVSEHEALHHSADADEESFGLGIASSLARKLEEQAEAMSYKPLANVHERKLVPRHTSVHSEAALLSLVTGANTPATQFQLSGASRILSGDSNEDEEPLVEVARMKKDRMSRINQPAKIEGLVEDNNEQRLGQEIVATRRRPTHGADDDDDDRPLSQIGPMLAPRRDTHARLLERPQEGPVRPASGSTDDTDEELPLGIRASILMAQKHPPVDLTQMDVCEEGPIGSTCSNESDEEPLGARMSVMRAEEIETLRVGKGGSEDEDDVPLVYRASGAFGPPRRVASGFLGPPAVASSAKSLGGRSDDVPLGMKYDDDVPLVNRLSRMNVLGPGRVGPVESGPGLLSPAKASEARQDTLAALEGRGKMDGQTDDDVPLGVTRAAHTVGGAPRRVETRKRKQAREAQKQQERLAAEESTSGSEDDRPLGVASQQQYGNLNVQAQQEQMMRVLVEQQKAAFGFGGSVGRGSMGMGSMSMGSMAGVGVGQQMYCHPFGGSGVGVAGVPGGVGGVPGGIMGGAGGVVGGVGEGVGIKKETISRWRQDVG